MVFELCHDGGQTRSVYGIGSINSEVLEAVISVTNLVAKTLL